MSPLDISMDYGVGGWLPGAARSGFASVGGCVGLGAWCGGRRVSCLAGVGGCCGGLGDCFWVSGRRFWGSCFWGPGGLRWFAGVWDGLWFSFWAAHCGKGVWFLFFLEFFASVGEVFILAGGLGAGLSFYGVLRFPENFENFIISFFFLCGHKGPPSGENAVG